MDPQLLPFFNQMNSDKAAVTTAQQQLAAAQAAVDAANAQLQKSAGQFRTAFNTVYQVPEVTPAPQAQA